MRPPPSVTVAMPFDTVPTGVGNLLDAVERPPDCGRSVRTQFSNSIARHFL
jgi:hypothetical protein